MGVVYPQQGHLGGFGKGLQFAQVLRIQRQRALGQALLHPHIRQVFFNQGGQVGHGI